MHHLMSLILSLILIFCSVSIANRTYAADSAQTNGSCTRGGNPLQDAKDLMISAEAELQHTSKSIDAKQIDDAKKHGSKAAEHIANARKQIETHDRSFPGVWLSDFTAFTTDLEAAKNTSNALKTRVITLIKSLDDIAATMTCPRSLEHVHVTLLPPEPNSKDLAKKSANYKVYALGLNGSAQLVKDWTDRPFGDCKDCTRGISLNCRAQDNDTTMTKSQKEACLDGLNNGIGIRITKKDKKLDAVIKNGSKYTVTQQFNALEKILPPAGDQSVVQLFVLKQGAAVAPENLIYQVVISVH